MQYKDYYEIMGIARDATQDEIKRAYRKLARKYHPDVSKEPHAEQKFKEVGEAYEVLKDPEKRVAYDQLGKAGVAGEEFTPPPNWDAGFEFSGGGFTAGDAEAYSDFFETLFGRGAGTTRAHRGGYHARGEDHHAKVMVDLEDAYNGATRGITLQAPEIDASGHLHTRERTLNVRIPKGIRQGQKIRLAGQGSPGFGEGAAGDLYLEIEFKPHPFYRVEERDLYLELPVAPWEAALGATVKAPTPTGVVDLKIPPGSSSGRKLRLKGRGIPAKQPGDIYVLLKIALPPADSARAKSFYAEMQRELPFNPRARLGV
jgi:curved DNA-binding protein